MNHIALTPEGYAWVVFALGVIAALWLLQTLRRQARVRRELMRRAEEGQIVRLQQADIIESCNIGAAQARRSRS